MMPRNDESFKSILLNIIADARLLGEAKLELFQLQLVEKGAPKMAKAIFGTIFVAFIPFLLLLLLMTAGFALGLPFVEHESFELLAAITLGFLSISVFILLILIILLLARKSITRRLEASIVNAYINNSEAKDAEESDYKPHEPTDISSTPIPTQEL